MLKVLCLPMSWGLSGQGVWEGSINPLMLNVMNER